MPGQSAATNWVVITGAPSSGKTTLIRALHKAGYRVVQEVARDVIAQKLCQGLTMEAIKADKHQFEREILMAKVLIEKTLPKKERIFFDRAIPDSIAYFMIAGLNPEEAVSHSTRKHYEKIFVLDPLAFKKDRIRTEGTEMVEKLDSLLEESYRMLGYDLIRIPVMPVGKRLEAVLQALEKSRKKTTKNPPLKPPNE
jgi:predicted ATPase